MAILAVWIAAPTEGIEMFRDNDDNNVVIHAKLDPFIGTVFRDPDGKPWVHWEGEAPEGGAKLYAAPVVQPDMVMVPREPTEAMLDAAMNRYKHVSPEAKARYTQMHRDNFRCDYKAMIVAAEWKSNAEGKPTPD